MGYEPKYKGTVSAQPAISAPPTTDSTNSNSWNASEIIVVSAVAIGIGAAFLWYMHETAGIQTGPVVTVLPGAGEDVAIAANLTHTIDLLTAVPRPKI